MYYGGTILIVSRSYPIVAYRIPNFWASIGGIYMDSIYLYNDEK